MPLKQKNDINLTYTSYYQSNTASNDTSKTGLDYSHKKSNTSTNNIFKGASPFTIIMSFIAAATFICDIVLLIMGDLLLAVLFFIIVLAECASIKLVQSAASSKSASDSTTLSVSDIQKTYHVGYDEAEYILNKTRKNSLIDENGNVLVNSDYFNEFVASIRS